MAPGRKKNAPFTVTAENLGAALGQVARRLDAWKKQRAEIAAEIHAVMKSARSMLGDLGDSVASGASATATNRGGRPKGYKMSEETKRKLRAAWKRRKAATKDAKEKVTG